MGSLNVNLTRTVAILLVIMLHISANSFASFGDFWWISLIYDSLTRASVPLFFMLSGALLLNKNEPLKVFFKKRFIRIVIPLFFWSYIYLAYRRFYIGEYPLSLSPISILSGPVYYHLWFIYTIISIYLFIPMLRYYSIHASYSVKLFVLILWFFSQSIQPFSSFIGFNLFFGIDAGMIGRFVGFVLLGEFLVNQPYKIKKVHLFTVFVISSALTALFTCFYTHEAGKPNEEWFQYHSPLVIASAISLFLICIHAKPVLPRFTELVSNYSFGVYFVHIIIMQQISIAFIFTPQYFNTLQSIILLPIAFLSCAGVSLLICIVFSKIPYLRRVV